MRVDISPRFQQRGINIKVPELSAALGQIEQRRPRRHARISIQTEQDLPAIDTTAPKWQRKRAERIKKGVEDKGFVVQQGFWGDSGEPKVHVNTTGTQENIQDNFAGAMAMVERGERNKSLNPLRLVPKAAVATGFLALGFSLGAVVSVGWGLLDIGITLATKGAALGLFLSFGVKDMILYFAGGALGLFGFPALLKKHRYEKKKEIWKDKITNQGIVTVGAPGPHQPRYKN